MLRVSVIKRGQPIEAMRCEKQMHLSTISKKMRGLVCRRQRPISGEEKTGYAVQFDLRGG